MELKNKRGMVFTIMTIALLSFFLVTYSVYSIVQDRSSINKRIESLNSFVNSVEEDLSRHLYISGYRTIFILQQYTIDEYSYITDLEGSVDEIFFNGTLYGVQKPLMDDGKFSDILISLNNNAGKINAQIQMLDPSISIEQIDPWNIEFNLNITLIIKDKSNLASWNRTDSFSAIVPITTFLDPVYHVETSGRVENKIKKSPYSNFVSGADYSNLTNHFQNSYYVVSTSAPNFLDRLLGNMSASIFGIESLVYPQDLVDKSISVKYKSLIDYIYFSSSNPGIYSVPAVSDLIIDDQDSHLAKYNVSGTAIPA